MSQGGAQPCASVVQSFTQRLVAGNFAALALNSADTVTWTISGSPQYVPFSGVFSGTQAVSSSLSKVTQDLLFILPLTPTQQVN